MLSSYNVCFKGVMKSAKMVHMELVVVIHANVRMEVNFRLIDSLLWNLLMQYFNSRVLSSWNWWMWLPSWFYCNILIQILNTMSLINLILNRVNIVQVLAHQISGETIAQIHANASMKEFVIPWKEYALGIIY